MKQFKPIFCAILSTGLGALVSPVDNFYAAYAESPALGVLEEFQIHVGDVVHFERGSHVLQDPARQTLDRQALFLLENTKLKVLLTGNTADVDDEAMMISDDDARIIGYKRAMEVRRYLISKGVDAARITTESNGRERPRSLGNDDTSYAQNRNVFTQLVSGSSN